MKTKTLILLALIFGPSAHLALHAGDADVRVLAEASRFVYGPRGEWSEVPPEIVAFRNIYAEADAVRQFAHLYEKGASAGKMYALAGLSRLDRARYDKIKAEASRNKNWKEPFHVPVMSGCILAADSFERLTSALEADGLPGLLPEVVSIGPDGPVFVFVPAPSFDVVK